MDLHEAPAIFPLALLAHGASIHTQVKPGAGQGSTENRSTGISTGHGWEYPSSQSFFLTGVLPPPTQGPSYLALLGFSMLDIVGEGPRTHGS